MSGHIGGAVELAEQIGMWIEAEVVHTTATDVQQKFAVDVFARKYHLLFKDRKKAKEISAAVLEGENSMSDRGSGYYNRRKNSKGAYYL